MIMMRMMMEMVIKGARSSDWEGFFGYASYYKEKPKRGWKSYVMHKYIVERISFTIRILFVFLLFFLPPKNKKVKNCMNVLYVPIKIPRERRTGLYQPSIPHRLNGYLT